MRKLVAVGLLVGGLLGMAGPAMAQSPQIGIADPLTLAASGVLLPFFGDPGDVAFLEISSPVGDNSNLHMFFFDANCSRVADSKFLPLTVNDYSSLLVVGSSLPAIGPGILDSLGFFNGTKDSAFGGGLVAISGSNDGFSLTALRNPIHSRMYLFNASTGRSRIVDPIILDAAESPGNPNTWSPLRTAATFYALPEGAPYKTKLWFVCPKASITTAPYFTHTSTGSGATQAGGFPEILPHFPSSFTDSAPPDANGSLRAVVFDTNENPLVDIHTYCNCVRTVNDIRDISTIYGGAEAIRSVGTYTKIESTTTSATGLFAFTGYRSLSNVNSQAVNDFFGRLSNGSYIAIDGPNNTPNATPAQR